MPAPACAAGAACFFWHPMAASTPKAKAKCRPLKRLCLTLLPQSRHRPGRKISDLVVLGTQCGSCPKTCYVLRKQTALCSGRYLRADAGPALWLTLLYLTPEAGALTQRSVLHQAHLHSQPLVMYEDSAACRSGAVSLGTGGDSGRVLTCTR